MGRLIREAVAFAVVGVLWLGPGIAVCMAVLLLISSCRG